MPSPVLKRSVMLLGHKTSISLEEPFWQALREVHIQGKPSGCAA
jgi:predicted DNA-binding ribbon-helix-helix protein